MKIHHVSYKIRKGYSELIQAFMEVNGGKLLWEGKSEGRDIAMHFKSVVIMFTETEFLLEIPQKKELTHIAFDSEDPKKDIENTKIWFEARNIEVKTGKYNPDQFWLDCPGVFLDFVIQILNTE